ncbi:hypothetical protein Bpfe_001502 [Biomphalaria pfeifferi]|uniref:Uncharacterized protein n=1 Tax=Biomphalaria pfeifferi TaxID=112525 RepID=A0AAD8FM30_BIOPF|nr:hypothetical protein Bpfe_001502 [Biomphalaria pfeifferi]
MSRALHPRQFHVNDAVDRRNKRLVQLSLSSTTGGWRYRVWGSKEKGWSLYQSVTAVSGTTSAACSF